MATTPRGERTEAALLAAAKRVFAERGYFNAKIADICAEAGRSPGSFYNYFENKEQLLQRLAAEFIDEVLSRTRLVQRGDPYQNIEDAVTVYWNTYREYLPTLIALFQVSMRDPHFEAQWRLLRKRGLDNILVGVRKARREGFVRDVDQNALASTLASMLDFFCWTWLARGGEPGMPPLDEQVAIRTLSQVWYRSLYYSDAGSTAPASAGRGRST